MTSPNLPTYQINMLGLKHWNTEQNHHLILGFPTPATPPDNIQGANMAQTEMLFKELKEAVHNSGFFRAKLENAQM